MRTWSHAKRLSFPTGAAVLALLLTFFQKKMVGKEIQRFPPLSAMHLAKISFCMESQLDSIKKQLGAQDCSAENWWQCKITQETSCPEASWLERYYHSRHEQKSMRGESFLALSVGCNKGFDAVRTIRMGTGHSMFNKTSWNNAMGNITTSACGQHALDDDYLVEPYWQQRGFRRKGTMYCIEPMPATFADLKAATEKLNISAHGFVVSHAAISSAEGTAKFPWGGVEGLSGKEDVGIWYCESNSTNCVDVQMFTLDNYVENFVFENGPIDILQIDVEGYDFEVLKGASDVLARSRYLEFEYHNMGRWKSQRLENAVNLLQEKGFTCYWAGKGKLWRVTKCWIPLYDEWHGWSNIACVAADEIDLLWSMETMFLETIGPH